MYPLIFNDPAKGSEAQKLYKDAQSLFRGIINKNMLQAKAVVGFFPANAVGDDVEVYKDDQRKEVLTTFHFIRQQNKKVNGLPNLCLADFIAPKDSNVKDYIGGFALTTGLGIEKWIKEFNDKKDDYNCVMIKALADRLAEAFAEKMHEITRKELWGYAKDETFDNDDLIKEKYQGIRPAPGYPACPDHTEKKTLFDLLQVGKNASIELTETLAMSPSASICGWYFSHFESKYFGVGKIGDDQIEDLAKRKSSEIKVIEKWLAPNLNYII